jgi:hypothetical protein
MEVGQIGQSGIMLNMPFFLNKCVIVDIVFNFVGVDGNNDMIG